MACERSHAMRRPQAAGRRAAAVALAAMRRRTIRHHLGAGLLALGAPLGGGCDRLLGLDPAGVGPDAPPGDAAPDAGAATTRRTVAWTEYRFRADMTLSALDAASQQATTRWVLEDPSVPGGLREVAGIVGPGNVLAAELPADAPTTVASVSPDGVRSAWTLTSPDVSMTRGVWGAVDAVVAPTDAKVLLAMSLPTSATVEEAFRYDVIGPFVSHDLAAPAVGAAALNAEFSTVDMTAVTGAPSLFGPDDVIVVSRLRASAGITTLTAAYQVSGVAQGAGATAFTGGLELVTPDRLLTMVSDTSADDARIDAAAPLYTTAGGAWNLTASPLGPVTNQGISLASGGVVPGDGVTVSYGNPFEPRWPTVLTHQRYKFRDVTPDQVPWLVANVRLVGGFVTLMDAPGDGEAALTIPRPQALPTAISVDGTALTTDGQALPWPGGSGPLVIEVAVDDGGTCDAWGAVLAEFVADGARLVRTNRAVLRGQTTRFVLPRDAVQPGAAYVLRGECFVGLWPNLAAGDLTTRAFPYSYGYRDSPVFTFASG